MKAALLETLSLSTKIYRELAPLYIILIISLIDATLLPPLAHMRAISETKASTGLLGWALESRLTSSR